MSRAAIKNGIKMNPKTIFLEKPELRKFLVSVVNDPKFTESLVYVKAQLTASGMTTEQLHGAELFMAELLAFPIDEEPQPNWPKVGLNHNLDKPTKTTKAERLAKDKESK